MSVDWMDEAACRGYDPELWFRDQGSTGRSLATAKAVCAICPVMQTCRESALAGDVYGIWGGMTRDERLVVQRARLGVCGVCGVEFKRSGKARLCSDECRRTRYGGGKRWGAA